MTEWFESMAGSGFVSAMLWTLGALVLLLVVFLAIKIVRSLTFGTFVSGGRNRKTRLAVMDAAAVDSQRRLVLVRRDDVEHLLLIGGASDIVVEPNIRVTAPLMRTVPEETRIYEPRVAEERQPRPAPTATPTPAAPPAPVQPTPVVAAIAPARPDPEPVSEPKPQPRVAAMPAPAPQRAEPRPAPAPQAPVSSQFQQPMRGPAATVAPPPRPMPAPANAPAPAKDTLDDDLLRELEVTLDRSARVAQTPAVSTIPARAEPSVPVPATRPAAVRGSIDDEMTRLLGELSGQKR